jgi:5'-3' exoribonuclease 2
MQLNGQEYVAIDPSKTARGGAMHPSLPTRPAFDVVPKEEVGADTKKLNPTQKREKEAENMKRGVANMDAESSVDVVRNRRAIRMANMSAADRLRAEMNGETVGGEDEGEDTVKLERKDEDEKEELEPEQAKQVLEEQAEDEGVDEEIVDPAVGTDEDEGEAAVPLEGQQTLEDQDMGEDVKLTNVERGQKRKAGEVEAEDQQEDDGDDGLEAPPDIDSDQPASKKKLKFNADGTVDGYEDDVR